MLEKYTTGVSAKHLHFYVAWFEYLHDLKVDTGAKATSKKTSEKVLIDIINARVNITKAEIEAIGKNELQLPKASNKYMRLLNEKTEQMKEALEDKWFQFSDEDAFDSFKVRETMRSMPMNKLRSLDKKFGIARYSKPSTASARRWWRTSPISPPRRKPMNRTILRARRWRMFFLLFFVVCAIIEWIYYMVDEAFGD